MAVGAAGMKWLDLLESEFEKAYVDLDLMLGDIDEEQIDLMVACRKKIISLSAAFTQLAHKAQVVFVTNGKLEVFSFVFFITLFFPFIL